MVKILKQNKSSGFTLVEMIMVIFLFAFISLMSTNLFFTVIKTTSRTGVEKEVRQNGNFALNYMETAIRNAKQVNPCNTGMNSLTITNQDGSLTSLGCFYEDNVVKIASTSGTVTTSLTNAKVTIGSAGGTCASSTLVFDCSNLTPPVVNISFTLKQSQTSVKPEEQVLIPFQSSVSLRNY